MHWIILFLATLSPAGIEAFGLVARDGTPAELAEYVRTELILTFGVRVDREPERERIGFERIEIEGGSVVVDGTLRIPRAAFGAAEIWVGTGFSRFSGPGRARYVEVRRHRGRIVSASIHMNAL